MVRHAAFVGVMSLAAVAPARAQLFQLAPATPVISAQCVTNDDVAYDSTNNSYLIVGDANVFCGTAAASLVGVFSDAHANVTAPFVIDGPSIVRGVRAVYSSDLSNGAGGFGAFLVVWRGLDGSGRDAVNAQVVAYPGRLVGGRTTVALAEAEQVTVAYSPAAKRFLVAWALGAPQEPQILSEFITVGLDGRPLGSPIPLASPPTTSISTCFPGPDYWDYSIDVVWNARSGEFGVLYSQESGFPNASLVLARVAADARVLGRTTLGHQHHCSGRASALSLNTVTGNYVAVWPEQTDDRYQASELTPTGALINTTVLTFADELTPWQLVDVEFSPSSGTFLLVAWSGPATSFETLHALELGTHGHPIRSSFSVPSIGPWHAPRIAVRDDAPEWIVSFAGFGGQAFEAPPADRRGGVGMFAFGTHTIDAGCVGPDPFAFFGGGTCFNGGWLPPGMTPPSFGGCTTPDPFVAMGGGTCFNGGWLPPTMPLPSPPPASPIPPPPPVGCSTPDPFTAMGGGVCVNGGWVPHNHPLAGGSGGA